MPVVADRAAPHTFYAFDFSAGALYVSTDDGAHFTMRTQTLPKSGRGRLRALDGRKGDLWLTVENNGLYHSTDMGATFTHLTTVDQADAFGVGKAAPGQSYPVLYLTGRIGETAGVFRSEDIGAHWTRINDDQHQYGWIGQVITGDPRLYGRVYLGTNGRGILNADPVRPPAPLSKSR